MDNDSYQKGSEFDVFLQSTHILLKQTLDAVLEILIFVLVQELEEFCQVLC